MNITLELKLDEEQSAAITSRVAAWEAQNGTTIGADGLLRAQLDAYIGACVTEDYNAALTRLGELYRGQPYAARTALISNLESSITP